MIKAILFDAFATLFDVKTTTEKACEARYPGKGQEVAKQWRDKQLKYTWLRSLMSKYKPFDQVTQDSLRFVLNDMQLEHSEQDVLEIYKCYLNLIPYQEVTNSLRKMKHRLAILSNGTPAMLQSVVSNANLENLNMEIISVDPIHSYKPDPRVYQSAIDTLGVSKENILFVSSNGWDIAGAKSFGFTSAWVNRSNSAREELDQVPDYEVKDFNQICEILEM